MENYQLDDNLKILVIGAGSAACQIISSIKEQCLLRDQTRQEAKKSQKIDENKRKKSSYSRTIAKG